jgi:hypothetical protein
MDGSSKYVSFMPVGSAGKVTCHTVAALVGEIIDFAASQSVDVRLRGSHSAAGPRRDFVVAFTVRL